MSSAFLRTFFSVAMDCQHQDKRSRLEDDAQEKGVTAYRAAIIHSLSMTNLQMLPHGLLAVDSEGKIVECLDIDGMSDEDLSKVLNRLGVTNLIELPNRIIMPGFIDTHAHAPQYAFTGTGMHLPLLKW